MKPLISASVLAAALAAAAPAHAAARDLEGSWKNDRGAGSGLSEIQITYQGSTFEVWASAPCGRQPCDLGQATGYVVVPPGGRDPGRDAIGLSAGFESRDSSRQIIATMARGGRLQVTVIQSFKNSSNATYTTETFRRTR